ncbi:hypothetical protein CR513_25716, partial [Mucuna pruriens]
MDRGINPSTLVIPHYLLFHHLRNPIQTNVQNGCNDSDRNCSYKGGCSQSKGILVIQYKGVFEKTQKRGSCVEKGPHRQL